MKRKILIPLFLCHAFFKPGTAASPEGPLNILLFTADDLDRNSLACYGSEVTDISPHIDRFAAEGVRFTHAYVNNSICAPSRAILATGLYGHNSGVMGFMKMEKNSGIPLIMELLSKRGYRTGVLSKISHSTPKKAFEWDYAVYRNDLGNGRSPALYYEKTAEFLRSCQATGRPFYLMVNSNDPHRPFFNPEEPLKNGMENPSRIYSEKEVPVPGFLPDLPGVRKEVSHYYNSVKRLDDTFGKVMKALDETGFRDNTLVIFMSDNGVALPFAKCDNYYASSRTPWIARLPGIIAPGQVNDTHYFSEVDYLPTILEALGMPAPERLDGKSRWPLYLGHEQKNDPFIYTQIDNKSGGKPMPMRGKSVPMRGIQNGRYLYIFNAWVDGRRIYANNNEGLTMKAMEEAAPENPEIAERVRFFRYRTPEEFYDLKEDPDCLNNLIEDPARKNEIKQMQKMLIKKMRKSGDPLLKVFKKREHPGKILTLLYEIYPGLRRVDERGENPKER